MNNPRKIVVKLATAMDFVNRFSGKSQGDSAGQKELSQQKSEGGMFSGLGSKLNAAAGGGPESEKNEDMLDKGE